MTQVLVFDYDGVLFNPRIGQLYPQIPVLLPYLAERYTLAIASFNTSAYSYLKYLGLGDYFSAWRCGRFSESASQEVLIPRRSWSEIVTNWQCGDPSLGFTHTKMDQIKSISNEIRVPLERMVFFDDNAINVCLSKDYVRTIAVDSRKGLDPRDLAANKIIDSI